MTRPRDGGTATLGVVALAEVPFDELAAYEHEHFPAPRREFLRCWVNLPGATTLGCVRDGSLVGYGVLRPAVEGYRVRPLFADEPGVADAVFRSLLATAPGQPVFVDAPNEAANPYVPALVRRYALSEVFRTARMYNNAIPRLPMGQIYGVTSLETG